MKKRAAKSKGSSTRAKSRAAKPKTDGTKPKARAARTTRGAASGSPKAKRGTAKRSSRSAARGKRPNPRARPHRVARGTDGVEESGRLTELHDQRMRHQETSPALSAGDIDADWAAAESSGEESVGGSVATPDQDVVDEIGRALGVEQAPTQPVTTSEEILRDRARHRWDLEREASEEEDRRER